MEESLGLLAEKHPADNKINGVVGRIGRKMPIAPKANAINPMNKIIILFKPIPYPFLIIKNKVFELFNLRNYAIISTHEQIKSWKAEDFSCSHEKILWFSWISAT
jgi:hypothetical protein